jgi:hypothetical protein
MSAAACALPDLVTLSRMPQERSALTADEMTYLGSTCQFGYFPLNRAYQARPEYVKVLPGNMVTDGIPGSA